MRLTVLLIALAIPNAAWGYSVLTHEAVIDSAWDTSIKPVLLQRFPGATPEQLKEAHAYAYGGVIIQDLGYYPGGAHLFSDLAHYIRSGDFIIGLIRDATTLDEYAFALGSLAHYAGDSQGHTIAVNRAEPLLYPKLGKKYGPVMTYEQNPVAHVKTEFSFDVLQVARGYYAPEAYHDFIGFGVAKPLLDRAVQDTYCLHLDDIFHDTDRTLNTYRHGVSRLIPEATKVAWAMRGDEIQKHSPEMVRRKFIYNISRASYRKEWGGSYEKPGLGARFLAFLLKLTPKIGPLRDLAFKTPTPYAETLFQNSFDATLDEYRKLLREAAENTLSLPNLNFDTGKPYIPGEYKLADQARQQLSQKLAAKSATCPALQANAH